MKQEYLEFFNACPNKYMYMPIVYSMEELRQVLSYPDINVVGAEVIAFTPDHELFQQENLDWIRAQGRIRLSLAVALVSAAMLPVSMSAQSLAESGFIRNSDYKENIEKAVQGYPESQRIVAECYLAGTGVRKDVNEAWKWLVKAAGNGDIESQYIIGTLYRDGNGVRQNYEESAYWFRKAGKNGHHKAQVDVRPVDGSCARR